MSTVLGFLAQKAGLQAEDVVQHAVDPPAFEAVVRDDARTLQVLPQRSAQQPVDPRLASHLRFLQ